MRELRRTLYFLRSAVGGLRAHPLPSMLAIVTIATSLVPVGAFGLLLRNMEDLVDRFGENIQVTAYLAEGVSASERAELARRVATAEGVARVDVVSEQQALERFQRSVGSHLSLLDGLEENPLPASLEIVLVAARRTPEGVRRVAESIDGLPGIDEVVFGQEWLEGYERALDLVRGVALGLGAVLALAAVMIVSNTIRLAVYARRDEIEILSLVGASRAFVRTPFLLEGLAQGALGALLALTALYALFRLVLPGLESGLQLVLGFAAPRFLVPREAALVVGAGALLGLLGSALALARSARA
jgi:cell division transport system permease protein